MSGDKKILFVQTVAGTKINGEVEHWALNERTQVYEIEFTDGVEFHVPLHQVVFIRVTPAEALK